MNSAKISWFYLVSLAGRCWNGTTSPRLGEQARFVGKLLFLCILLFLITKFRDYSGQIMIFGAWALFGVLGAISLIGRAWAHAGQAVLAIFLLIITLLGSRWVNLLALVSPQHPAPVMEKSNPDGLFASTVQPPVRTLLALKLRVDPLSPLSDLKRARDGFLGSGGELVGEEIIQIGSLWDTLCSMPVGVGISLFYPPPWRWAEFLAGGVKAKFYLLEAVMILVLMPFVLGGIVWFVCERRWSGLFLLFLTVLFLVPYSLVVSNYGTLFRLRLQFLVPLLMIAAIGVERLAPLRLLETILRVR